MKQILLLITTLMLVSCAGHLSTLKEGYAYQISKPEAEDIVTSVMHVHTSRVSVRKLSSGGIEADGYDRSIIDTQFYNLAAIPSSKPNAFGFEVKHKGTMFNGPRTAKRIYDDAKYRASLKGSRVTTR